MGHYPCCYIGKIRKQGRSRIQILLTKQHSRFPYTRRYCTVRKTGSSQPVRADSPVGGMHEGQLQDRLTEVSSGQTEGSQQRRAGRDADQATAQLRPEAHFLIVAIWGTVPFLPCSSFCWPQWQSVDMSELPEGVRT